MRKQFSAVDCSRGAPMGRASFGQAPATGIRLFRVYLTDGYDTGGAYWGFPNDLYCAEAEGYRAFTRAENRIAAMMRLDLTPAQLLPEETPNDDFLYAYLEATLWTSTSDDDSPLDSYFSVSDFSDEAYTEATRECAAFLSRQINGKSVAEVIGPDIVQQAGRDFWLTRNGHGVWFWSSPEVYGDQNVTDALSDLASTFGERYVYVGIDGKLYFD